MPQNHRTIKILFFADSHLGFDFPLRPRINRRRRGPDFFNNYNKICSYALANKVDLVIHGGDVFFRSKVAAKIVDLAYESLLQVAKAGIPVFLVPGNHERSKLPVSILLLHPNIHIFDKPRTYYLAFDGIKTAISGFPFVRYNIRQSFQANVDLTGWQNNPADLKILCLHQAIEGARVGPVNYTFRTGRDVIRMEDIPNRFSCILSGHIHRRQVLGNECRKYKSRPLVIYPGSIERTSFAEKDEQKGFYLLEFYPGQNNGRHFINLDFNTLPTRPMIELKLGACHLERDKLISQIQSMIAGLDPNSIVKFKCPDNIDKRLLSMLSAPFFREIAPATMTISLSTNVFKQKQ